MNGYAAAFFHWAVHISKGMPYEPVSWRLSAARVVFLLRNGPYIDGCDG